MSKLRILLMRRLMTGFDSFAVQRHTFYIFPTRKCRFPSTPKFRKKWLIERFHKVTNTTRALNSLLEGPEQTARSFCRLFFFLHLSPSVGGKVMSLDEFRCCTGQDVAGRIRKSTPTGHGVALNKQLVPLPRSPCSQCSSLPTIGCEFAGLTHHTPAVHVQLSLGTGSADRLVICPVS